MNMNFHTIKVLIEKELLDSIRNRWFYISLAIFMFLSFIIIYFGVIKSSGVGFERFNKTTASLLNLILFLIPMITLLLGSTSISGEREQGTLQLILSKPISGIEYILGKYFGIALAFIFSIFLGFGTVGMIVAFYVSRTDAKAYFLFIGLSILLALSFLSIAIFVSVLVKKRLTAIIVSTILWFWMILLYDFVVMSAANLFTSKTIPIFLLASILLNPADGVRILAIVKLGGETVFGPSLVDLTRMITNVSSELLILFSIIVWIVLPLFAAMFFFKRSVQK